ncbi:MAG: NADH-quinone oxidoreductase subunit NuoE [Nitrospinaceae bacterium]
MFVFTVEAEQEAGKILAKYPVKLSALLPLLHLAQDQEGYVTPGAMVEIGKRLEVSPAYVQSVCTFYTMFHTRPVGRYIILFCHNISCHLLGADDLLNYTAGKLGIEVGNTTADRKFTLLREECLAGCCGAPMMRVNEIFYERLTRERIDEILDALP